MSPTLTAAFVGALLTLGVASRPPDVTTPSVDTAKPSGTVDVAASPRLRALLEGLTATLTCSEAASATAALRVGPRTARALGLEGRKGRPVSIATGRAQCTPRRGADVTLKPRGEIAERLRRARRSWKSRLNVTLADAAGNTGRLWTGVIVRP